MVKVTDEHLVTVQLSTSKPDVRLRLSVSDNDQPVASVEAKGHAVLPVVILLPSTTPEDDAMPRTTSLSCERSYPSLQCLNVAPTQASLISLRPSFLSSTADTGNPPLLSLTLPHPFFFQFALFCFPFFFLFFSFKIRPFKYSQHIWKSAVSEKQIWSFLALKFIVWWHHAGLSFFF